jgi:YD repeat-containing protein
MPESDAVCEVNASRATVSSLLDQLTEIHDRQQSDRKLEWDAFLRKRQKALAEGKKAKGKGHAHGHGHGMGEEEGGWGSGVVGLIGFAQLGRSGKEEERKMFGRLVRGGIPLAYRSDIWAGELCSG